MFGTTYKSAGASVGAARILRFIKVLRSMKSVKALKERALELSLFSFELIFNFIMETFTQKILNFCVNLCLNAK